MLNKNELICWLAVLMFSAGSVAHGAEILKDSFSLGGGRVAGSSLDGTALEVGGVAWDVSSGAPKLKSSEDVWMNPAVNSIAKAAISDIASAQVIEFQVDVLVTGTSPQVLLGFGVSSANGNWQEGVRFGLKGDGTYGVSYNDGSFNLIDSGGLGGSQFNSGSYNTLKMSYDPAENTLSAWVNSTQIISDYDFDGVGFIPTLDVAGFSALNPTTNERWDNFLVQTDAPEKKLKLVILTSQ